MSRDMDYKREYRSPGTFVDGNTVRKLDVAVETEEELRRRRLLEEEREYELEIERKKKMRRIRMQRERFQKMDLFSVLFLTVAIAVTAYTCVGYLKVQSQVTSMSKKTASMEKEILELKEENKTIAENITSDIDLDYIYKVATKKLGMVHPSEDQVVTYKSTKSDAVKQYGDIPSGSGKSLLERILGE